MWVFIDGQLVMDLGGVWSAEGQYLDLDRLGLSDGATYSLDFFYANRRSTDSVFRMRTTLEIETSGVPITVSSMFN